MPPRMEPSVQDRAIAFTVDDVDDAERAQRSCIEGLTTRRRIKGRSVEDHRPSFVLEPFDADDFGLELANIGIGVVEALCHECRYP